MQVLAEIDEQESLELSPQVQLKKLGTKHREVLSLVAQGLSRTDVASIVGFTPEYISWLVRQDVCRLYSTTGYRGSWYCQVRRGRSPAVPSRCEDLRTFTPEVP